MHSKLHDIKGKTYLSIYLSTYMYMYIYCIHLSIHPYIKRLSMSVSVCLEITKMYLITVCSTRDLWFYHKNAIILPMRTLKFSSFTDIKSVALF